MLVGSSPIPLYSSTAHCQQGPQNKMVLISKGQSDRYQTEKGLHLEILDSTQSSRETPPSQFQRGLLSPPSCLGPTRKLENSWSSGGTPVAQKA